MKTSVIAPLGLSPPVITTFIEGIGETVNDLVILTTDNERVKEGYEIVRIGLKIKYPKIRVHEVRLPFDDIYTTKQNLQFMSIAAGIIKKEREVHKSDKILLNVAGGRKNTCITLSLLGQIMGVDGVFHVVTKDVVVVNLLLERLRRDISMVYRAGNEEEKINIYKKNEKQFDNLLFPPKSAYEIVKIPTLPYPKDYLAKLLKSIFSLDLDSLSIEEKEALYRHGILEKIGNRYYLSKYGEDMVSILIQPRRGSKYEKGFNYNCWNNS